MLLLVACLLVASTYMHTVEACCCMPEKFELHEYVEDVFTWPFASIQTGFLYVYDLRSKYCKKLPIGKMSPVCVPAYKSTYITDLGAAKDMISVKIYQSTSGNQTTITTVTKEKCYLISSELYDSEYPTSLRTQFYGTTLGIKDPSVFKIPAICKKIFWNTQEIPEVHRRGFHPFYL